MIESQSPGLQTAPHLNAARSALEEKRYRDAHTHCMAVLKVDSNSAEAFHLLGLLAADHGNFAKALELQDRALSLGHASSAPQAQAARCLIALSRRSEAVERARLAALGNPEEAHTLDTIGVVLSRAGHHAEAVDFYDRATQRAPRVASYQYNFGAALQFVGNFESAREAFDRCLSIDPQHGRALVAKVSITKQTPEVNDLRALESAWAARDTENADEALQLAHALAKTCEDLGDTAQSMVWLDRGKREKRKSLPSRRKEDAALFHAAQVLADRLSIAPDADGEGPIFIVGMPRTGTTLVDRILASHSQVKSAGELSDFSIALKRQVRTPGALVLDPATLDAAAGADLAKVGQNYIDQVAETLGLRGRFTDKMPLNLFFVPAILAALPTARIICLRRHPADTVISNYRQLFATAFSYYRYAYDLEDTAEYVAGFNRLASHYLATLPSGRFICVDYEAVVDDLEGQTRRLLDFCALDFEPACLEFHTNDAPVATASSAQVRKPIYSTSIGRWTRYRPTIDPALEILKSADLLSDQDLLRTAQND